MYTGLHLHVCSLDKYTKVTYYSLLLNRRRKPTHHRHKLLIQSTNQRLLTHAHTTIPDGPWLLIPISFDISGPILAMNLWYATASPSPRRIFTIFNLLTTANMSIINTVLRRLRCTLKVIVVAFSLCRVAIPVFCIMSFMPGTISSTGKADSKS